MSGTNDSSDDEFDADYIDELDDDEVEEELEEIPTTERIPPSQLAGLVEDPWPKTVFFITIIGFIIVLFTPPDTWSIWNWTLVATYGLITLDTIVSPFSLRIWYEGEGWLRYVGIGNFVIMNSTVVIGTIDTLLWVSTGTGILPGFEAGSILLVTFVIVVFLAYSLYFAFRFLTGEESR